jgi:hypothetical protein
MLRKTCASLIAACAIGAVAGAPAASAQPIITGGLVNVTITNVANNNDIDVTVPVSAAVNIAATVCNVPVSLLSNIATQSFSGTCTTRTGATNSTITITPVP